MDYVYSRERVRVLTTADRAVAARFWSIATGTSQVWGRNTSTKHGLSELILPVGTATGLSYIIPRLVSGLTSLMASPFLSLGCKFSHEPGKSSKPGDVEYPSPISVFRSFFFFQSYIGESPNRTYVVEFRNRPYTADQR